MNKFTYGVITGISALTIGAPFVAQIAGAASGDTSSVRLTDRPVPTKECILAMANAEDAQLARIDEMTAAHKAALQTHITALRTAASIADKTDLQAALQEAHEAMRNTIDEAREDETESKELMDALKTECRDTMMFKGFGMPMMHMGPGKRHGPGDLAEKLGMTPEELKIALQSGKTIEDIATEKGIELPARGKFFMQKQASSAIQQ